MKVSRYQETMPGMDNYCLQLMALSMNDYNYEDIEAIYRQFDLNTKAIPRSITNWKDKGWAVSADLFFYNYRIRISPTAWEEVMRTITPERLKMLFKLPAKYLGEVNKSALLFSEAYSNFVNQLPYENLIKKIDWKSMAELVFPIMTLTNSLAIRAANADFVKLLPDYLISNMYYSLCVDNWAKLTPSIAEEPLHTVFLDNKRLDKNTRIVFNDYYQYYCQFLKNGHFQEVIGQLSGLTELKSTLRALELLHQGKAEKAFEVLTQELKDDNDDIFHDGLSNFAYALSIGLSRTPLANKVAEKLLKSRKAKKEYTCHVLLTVLHHFFRSDADAYTKEQMLFLNQEPLTYILEALFLKHYHIKNGNDYEVMKAERLLAEGPYDYLKLLYSFDFNRFQSSAKELQQRTGITTSPMPYEREKAQWELVIDKIMNISAPAKATATAADSERERIIYQVSTDSYTVQPRLQKSKDGGVSWSKGRNIALAAFKNGDYSRCMTQQDFKVAALVDENSYWYGSNNYNLRGHAVVAALIGHPNVYSMNSMQHIDIIEEPLQMTVQPSGKGFTMKANVILSGINEGVYISKVGDKQLTVIRVSEQQKKILELMMEVTSFPEESQGQLTGLLESLSKDFTVMSPLLKDSKEIRRVEANSLIAVQISPSGKQNFSVALAVKPFGSHPPYQKPAKGMEVVSTTIDGERVQTVRDLEAEKENLNYIYGIMLQYPQSPDLDDLWDLDTAECLELLEQLRNYPDRCFIEWPQGVKMRVTRPMITAGNLSLKISSAGQWFELEGDVKIGDKEKIKVAQLMELLRSSTGNFVKLEGDEYIALNEQLRRQLQAIDKMLVGRGKELKIAAINGMQLEGLEEIGVKVKADDTFRQLIGRIEESGKQQYPLPANLHAELRGYQVVGYEWLSRLAYWGAGACLADDMGLGKTLQAIAVMLSRATQGPQLVVMPTSLLLNWQSELHRFAPTLNVKLLNPQTANRQQIVTTAESNDVVLSTYGLLVTEGELLSQRTWTTIVLDEAHSIKNRETQTSKWAMQLKADFRLMLTGTPLQNHLNEIWNLFQFANPGLLGSYQQFTDRFILPIERDRDRERQQLLRRLLSPFLLRRTKDEVLSELPEKTEITVRVELSPDEMALYDNLRQQAIANLEEGSSSALQTLAEITRLRQAACHPRLIDPQLPLKSSKTQAFLALVDSLRQSGHRALVFSQFTSHLALIREELDSLKIPYLYLDGSTSATERNRLVKKFQTGDQPLFLISLKAGGLGLNLTAADYVIHLDPWWNPAIEDQASDRAHRIGQQRPVTVYRLICAGTIEEKIIRLHQNKRSMADALLQDADMHSQISPEEVLQLLRENITVG